MKVHQPFTVKSFQIKEAPPKISLIGDKTKRPEPAQHIIEFPGGAIELSRTTDGNYWAHIMVNHKFSDSDMQGLYGAFGEIIGARVDSEETTFPLPIAEITQVAILIKPIRTPPGRS